jgi:hypothetical protein
MADSNYGSTFTKGGSTIGKCIVVDFPELSTEKINITNHDSNGKTQYIPSKLIDAGDITLSVLAETTELSGIYTDMEAESIEQCIITNPVDTMTFSGWYQSVKEEPADAQSPDAVKLTVILAITGGVVVS